MAVACKVICAITRTDRLSSGLRLLEEETFDVVLVDLGLPDSGGIDTLRRLQEKEPRVPVIVLTGLSDEEFALKAISSGAQDYLIKGKFDETLLYRSVRYAIERKKLHLQLSKSMSELRRAYEELEQFSFVLAHDLKGPLLAIEGFARLTHKKYSAWLDKSVNGYLATIQESARRMLKLIDNLRAYVKSSVGPKELNVVDMNRAVSQAVDNLRLDIEAYDVHIRTESLPVIWGDEVQIMQLCQNLIGNSIKYRKESEPLTISISSERHADEWVFRFKDNGIGIQNSLFEKIFMKFQRGSAAAREGLGLGLTICKRIVERHGGRIWVNAKLGKGSSFYFSIPQRV